MSWWGRLRQVRAVTTPAVALALAVALTLARSDVASGRSAATLQVCANPPATFTTIQAAVDTAVAGDQIQVCAGTFTEQVLIDKSVTLVGAGAAQTKILAPTPLTGTQDIVTITNPVGGSAVAVDLSGFTVSGPGGPENDCPGLLSGVFVRGGAQARIHGNVFTAIRTEPLGGCQKGIGVRVGRAALPTTGTATITGNTFTDIQKGGIVVDGDGSAATITDNTITGVGPTKVIAQNGIQVSRKATATVSGNKISAFSYTGSDTTSTGILLFDVPDAVTVSKNTISGSDDAISVFGGKATSNGAVTLRANTISGGDRGIILEEATGTLVGANKIAGATSFGLQAEESAKDNTFEGNEASGTRGDGHFDCRDASAGDRTANTANRWLDNTGETASPDGICSPKQEPPPSPTPEPEPPPQIDLPPVVIVLPPLTGTPDASEDPIPSPPPPEPSPTPPVAPAPTPQPGGPITDAKADEIITTMEQKQLKSCLITLTARGPSKLLIAQGFAKTPGVIGRGALLIRLGLLPRGQQMLSKNVGGVLVRVKASCRTTANATAVSVKTARAVLKIEHSVTTPGSWVPDLPLLTPTGTRFVSDLAKQMVKVNRLRCDGYTATWPPSVVDPDRLSFARATLVCGMLKRSGVKATPQLVAHGRLDPIASNNTEAGRAANRRVAVTFVHILAARSAN